MIKKCPTCESEKLKFEMPWHYKCQICGTTISSPGNKKPITELFAFISSDENGEGIMSMGDSMPGIPLVFGDRKIAGMMMSTVQRIAKTTGRKIKLIRMTERVDLEEF